MIWGGVEMGGFGGVEVGSYGEGDGGVGVESVMARDREILIVCIDTPFCSL